MALRTAPWAYLIIGRRQTVVVTCGPDGIVHHKTLPTILPGPAVPATLVGTIPAATVITYTDMLTPNAVEAAARHGWRSHPSTGAWSTWRRGYQTVWLAAADALDPDRTPLFSPADVAEAPDLVATRCEYYTRATGELWRYTAGVVGTALIRELDRRRASVLPPHAEDPAAPLWHLDTDDPLCALRGAGDIRWRRPITVDDDPYPYVMRLDLVGQYLAAAGVAPLPINHPGPVAIRPTFEAKLAGWWLVRRPQLDPDGLPWLAPAADDKDTVWLTTPMVDLLLREQIIRRRDLIRAAVTGRSRRILRTWSETLTEARAATTDLPDAAAAVKRTYTEAIGMLNRPGGGVYRPDWRWTIMDMARANLLRKIRYAQITDGRTPIAIDVDSVWWPVTSTNIRKAADELNLRIGTRPGCWRHVSTMPLAQYAAPFADSTAVAL